jgi:pseudouridine-5'-phosphate glycosidase
MIDPNILSLNPEIASALAQRQPVVALESTVIAHGLPRPRNLETAKRLEQIVREGGVTPATIAILNGKICVGLGHHEIERIAESNDVKKISTRDLALAVAERCDGATTVASTIWVAQRVGIQVFATGGIGGVHRGSLPDISADLPELAHTPIVVVCSGAKIVLDLPATREWLETHSVTLVGFQCDEMPAFYSRRSGLSIDTRADSAEDVARIFAAQRDLRIASALLVTVPVPTEFEIPIAILSAILDESLAAAEQQRISGPELTPFLLSRMAQESEGATLTANIALLENNARVAAEIAKAIRPLFAN